MTHCHVFRSSELYGDPVREKWKITRNDEGEVRASVIVYPESGSRQKYNEDDVPTEAVPTDVLEEAERLFEAAAEATGEALS